MVSEPRAEFRRYELRHLNMRAVVLAGGKGTRLHPYTTVLPKPLLPVGDQPIIERIIRRLCDEGFRQIELCVGHLGGLIEAYLARAPALPPDVTLTYHWEDQPLGTAGALRRIAPGDEPFLVMNGDVLTAMDLGGFMGEHAASNASLSIAVTTQEVPLPYGVIEVEGDAVVRYLEKPAPQFTVSMGVYAYSPDALEFLPEGAFDFPDLVQLLLAEGRPVRVHPFDGFWLDVGTIEQHAAALTAMQHETELTGDA